jgi:membrane-bound lytic murein transglycosylase A
MRKFVKYLYIILSTIAFTGCSTTTEKHKPISTPTTHFVTASFEEFEGWEHDMHEKSFQAFVRSCSKIINKKSVSNQKVGENLGAWKSVCKSALHLSKSLGDLNNLKGAKLAKARHDIRYFFERHFTPYKVGMSNHGRSLTFNARITGYYEIELQGTRYKHRDFPHPIHKPPSNLKQLKGCHAIKRSAINSGSLDKHKLEIAWVNDMSKLYFMHIQGTGVIRLKEGGEMPLVWGGENGFSFKALPAEYVGSSINVMNKLRKNGKKGHQDMNRNDSYIFFKGRTEQHPVGAQAVMLTPERSAAIDSRIYPYGVPIWIETRLPKVQGHSNGERYRRLLIGQDRGGAIKGGGRIDLFFGRGKRAENIGSGLNVPADMYVLFPKGISIPKIFDLK